MNYHTHFSTRATPEAIALTHDGHVRRGGGGPGPKPDLLTRIRDNFNNITLGLRNRARNIARQQIFVLEDRGIPVTDPRRQRLDSQFNSIARGGLGGVVTACRVLCGHARTPS